MKILFLSRWFPYPPDNGSKIRIYNILRQLAATNEIDLISFVASPPQDGHLLALQRYCHAIWTVPYRAFQPYRWSSFLGYFSWKPRSVIDTYSPELDHLTKEAVRNNRYDLVIASQIDMAPYAISLPLEVRILEELELTVLHDSAYKEPHALRRVRRRLTWWKTARYLSRLLNDFTACTVVSELELERLKEIFPTYSMAEVIPNCIDPKDYEGDFGEPQPDILVYSGSVTYQANLDAVEYFIREVFPLIRSQRPQVRFVVLGSTEGVTVNHLLEHKGVIFTGYQEDIRPWVKGAWVSVVPLRLGGGTRLKILESLALGTPVVATSKGVEGLDLIGGKDILIADHPEQFAKSVLDLLDDVNLRHQLANQGRQTVIERYNWDVTGKRLQQYLEYVLSPSKGTLASN